MIIAFIGKKQSGKSTACEYLSTDNTIRINFKDALLKEVVEKFSKLIQEIIKVMDILDYDGMNPWTVERLIAEKPPLFRALLQNYGTDVCRAIDESYFVKTWEEKVQEYHNHRILTDDCRFLSEAEAVKRLGGVLIRIVRDDMQHTDTHLSETEQDKIQADFTVVTVSGEFNDFYKQLDAITKKLML